MIGVRASSLSLPITVLFLLLMMACEEEKEGKKEEEVLAEAYGESLSRSDLRERMPSSITEQDSQRASETAVRNWVREKVLLKKAEEELSSDQKDLRKRIEAYRRSLLINSLEKERVKNELDTSVEKEELRSYYRDNKKEFVLDEAILKKVHVQLKKDSIRYLSRMMRAIRKDSAERSEAMKPLCRAHAVHCATEGKDWVRLKRLLTRMPLKIDDKEGFLEQRRVQRYDKEKRIFLIRVLDHRSKRDTAPFSMVKGKTKRMIINERKRSIVDRLHKNALLDARKNDKVRIH